MTGPLAGRTAVVTGASRGIGGAVARVLHGAGAHVALVARGREALDELAGELRDRALVAPGDLTRADDVATIVASVLHAFGGAPHILVSNAGLFSVAPLEETSVEHFESMLDVNLVSPFRLLRALLPAMRALDAAHVVTIGSVADRAIFPGNAAYAPAKFGARALHEVLRAETRGSTVRATLVSPGPTDTAAWDPIDPDSRPGFTPRRLMLRVEDVADAVLWAVTRPATVNVDELRLSRS